MAPRNNVHTNGPLHDACGRSYPAPTIAPSSLSTPTSSSGSCTSMDESSSSSHQKRLGNCPQHNNDPWVHKREPWFRNLVGILLQLIPYNTTNCNRRSSFAKDEEEEDETTRRRRKYYAMVAGILVTSFAYASYQKRSAKALRTTSQDSQTILFRTIVSFWAKAWKAASKHKNGVLAAFWGMLQTPAYSSAETVPLGHFFKAANQPSMIRKVLLDGTQQVFFQVWNEGWKRTSLPTGFGKTSDLVHLLTTKGECTDITSLPKSFWSQIETPLLVAFPFVYLAMAYKFLKGLQNGNNNDDFVSSTVLGSPKDPPVTFADIAGLETLLPEVQEIISYLQSPQTFDALGAQPPRGILLHGSPGVGKTMLAKAIAGEASCDAFCVCSGSEFCEVYVGKGASRVRSLFQDAKTIALYNHSQTHKSSWFFRRNPSNPSSRPPTAILFIDELDAVAKSRSYGSHGGNDERDQTLNQLLTEMDGFRSNGASDPLVIVIAATNRPELLDPAILRRFDKHIHVPYPNKDSRAQILKVHASKTKCRFSTIQWQYLAEETPGFSGSDLKQVINDAALLAVRMGCSKIEQGHVLQSIQRSKTMKVKVSSRSPTDSLLPFVVRS